MNTAERWQDKLKERLKHLDFVALNPRRDDWDSAITQSADDPRFSEQVNWELDGLQCADIVAFYFDPNTKSPVTLLELGLIAGDLNPESPYDFQRAIVCCPQGFWRRGNIEIVCERHGITLVDNFEAFVDTLSRWIQRAHLPPG